MESGGDSGELFFSYSHHSALRWMWPYGNAGPMLLYLLICQRKLEIWILLKISQLFSVWLIYFKTLHEPNKTLSAGCGPPANDLFGLIMKHFNVAYGNPSDEFIVTP